MHYRILGELEVVGTRGVLPIAASRHRVVLAALLLEANHMVPVSRLVDAVWDESPPSTARSQIQICVSALRRSLAQAGIEDAIVTRAPGYVIQVRDGALDLQVFDKLAVAGRAAVAERRLTDAADLYGEALSLWRGSPFAGIDSPLLQAAAVSLTERRLTLVEDSVDLQLQLGHHHELIGELMALTAKNPVRERLRAQLMTALYRDGRQAEALDAYRQARRAFLDELGLEPGRALQKLERAILVNDPELDASVPSAVDLADQVPGPVVPPRLLPADVADFTGHETLVAELCEVLAGTTRTGEASSVQIVSVSGKGGVGKTTLAVHLAHQLADEFPDGQLYVTLRGNDARPVSPAQVLERFLRALGVPGSAIPEGLEERAEMYRDRLAGRRMLVVLDDAAGEEQIAPLLPGTGTSAIVITSRLRLARLSGAYHADLKVFELAPALELLTRVAGPERVNAEPEAARTLAVRCGGLPLALRIAGARLAARPHWTLAKIVARLEDEHRRLDELAYGGVGIRSNIGVAYEGLSDTAKRLFRRLGMLETVDFDAWVSMPLLDAPADEAEDALESLVDVQLMDVERIGRQGVRYRFHDLIRVYARERLAIEEPPEERRAALRRAMNAWLYLAREAHRREYGGDFTVLHGAAELWPLPGSIVDELLAEPLEWYERDRLALVAAVRQAADGGLDELCWDLAMSTVTLFEARSYREDWRETHTVALAAVQRAGNRRGEAAMLYSLGALSLNAQRLDEAERGLTRAMEMFTELGDVHGCGLTQRNLAYLDRMRGDTQAALARYQQALVNVRTAGDTVAEAHALGNLAQVQIELGRHGDAERLLATALDLTRWVGARRVEAQILFRLGEAYLRQDKPTRAAEAFGSVLAIVSVTGDPIGAAYALYGLGVVHTRLGDYREAEPTLRRAQRMAVQAGDQLLVARVSLALGEVHRAAGRLSEALDRIITARDLFAQIGARPLRYRAEDLLEGMKATTG